MGLKKQDKNGVRTAADLERRYGFGKTKSQINNIQNQLPDKLDSDEYEKDKVSYLQTSDELTETDINNILNS